MTDRAVLKSKLATLAFVREYTEGEQVELWLNEMGRVVVRAFNEGGNNYTEVDLFDLLQWAHGAEGYGHVRGGISALPDLKRDQ